MNSIDGSIGFSSLVRILRKRSWWLLLGTVLGLVAAGLYLFVIPTTYTGTAQVNITAVSSEPVTEGRAVSSLVDLSTERQLAASSNTAQLAAEYLGEGWTAKELMSGVSVSGDPEGTVLRISYTDIDQQRAIEGADQLAKAYLQVRTSLVLERVASVVNSIDTKIEENERELETLMETTGGYDPASSVRVETLRNDIQALQERRSTWNDISVQAGQVITPASANDVRADPVRWRVLVLGLFGGLFLGVLLVLVRQLVARRPTGPEEIEDLLDVPVWRPVGDVGDQKRWELAAEMVRHANRTPDNLAVLVDWNSTDGRSAASALTETVVAAIIDINNDRAQILRALIGVQSAVLVVPLSWPKKFLTELVKDIESIDVALIGVIVVAPNAKETQ